MGAAVEVEGVAKRFRLQRDATQSLKERVIRFGRNPTVDFWALRDVDFDVAAGETMGLLGHNGSGKSTLLKCVAGILRPSEGRIRTAGRMAALLELGAGFHPELTGRENVYLNGSILGLPRREVEKRFDDIVAFAELEPFIDNQVKHYSSGMYARLGFAVAVNVEPDVLLVDEVLSVGDEAFQRKCIDRVKAFQREGRTILVVTHAADLVRQVCDRAVVLDHGNVLTVAAPGDAVRVFRESLLRKGIDPGQDRPDLQRDRGTRILGVGADYPEGQAGLFPGDPLVVHVDVEAVPANDDVVAALEVHDVQGNRLLGTNTDLLGVDLGTLDGQARVTFRFGSVPLLDGTYLLALGLHTHDGGLEYDHREGADTFSVTNPGRTQGLVHFAVEATITPRPAASPIA
ncbi:MAG: ABC transporter ATP-binding protein [Acidimicrobiia bacterium]|nr:ABC transporter ATP-binding protein [Acidimicrobiia bacterium]